MKIFLIISAILVSLVGFAFWILFTFSGNNVLRPYIESVLTNELGKEVVLKTFTLKTNFIDTEINIDKNSTVIINGDFNIIRKKFNLEYLINSKNLDTPYVNIEGILKLTGKLSGTLNKFNVEGNGQAFRSDVIFSTSIENNEIKDIQLKGKGIKTEDILAFVKKPLYTKGIFDINADIQNLSDGVYKGNFDVQIHYGSVNNLLIQRDFGIKLAQAIIYQGTINSNIEADELNIKSNIVSNLAQIETQKTKINLKTKEFSSDYKFQISNLSALDSIVGVPLQGSIIVTGNIKKDKDDLIVDANSNTLGGTLKAVLFNNSLKFDLTHLKLADIATMLKKPKYSDGILNLSVDMQDIREDLREGKILLHVEDARLDEKIIKKEFELDIPTNLTYKLSSNGTIKKNIVSLDSELLSKLLTLNLPEAKFDTKSSLLNGKYTLHVSDLNQLEFLTKRAMQGNLTVDGKYALDQGKLTVDGNSNFLNAKTLFTLKNELLQVQSEGLSIAKLTDMLLYPKVFESLANLNADYNLTSSHGIFEINALNGMLQHSELTNIVQLASGFDLTKEVFKDSLLKGIVDKKKIDFSLMMRGIESHLKIPKGLVDLETNNINSSFDIKIQNKDFKGSIKGKLDKPQVNLDSSEYLKQKIDKAIDKNLPEEWKDPVKNLLKLFG